MNLVIVTGLSGAGKSQTIRCLEDLGYYCVDNMPPSLIPKFAQICYNSQGKIQKAALVIDTRGKEMFAELFNELDTIAHGGYTFDILFLEASDECLIKRYKETRRKHPMSESGMIADGIRIEREMLKTARDNATYIIDTTNLLSQQLKEKIVNIFAKGEAGLIINTLSFGFKYGIPLEADLVFDVRFLPNPFYIEQLKHLTGKDEGVSGYVNKFSQTQEFKNKLKDMITFLIPYYIEEGKTQLVIAIGCTGGKHRSVSLAEDLYEFLHDKQYRCVVNHRDIEKK